jgi:hypothetical protein
MEETQKQSPITLDNAVIKTEKKFLPAAKRVIKEEGVGSFLKKTGQATYDTGRRFFS